MSYETYAAALTRRLTDKKYVSLAPQKPLALAMVKHGSLAQTYVVGVHKSFAGTTTPNDVLHATQGWFQSLFGNNGGGLILFVYQDVPDWALKQVQGFSGQVVGGII